MIPVRAILRLLAGARFRLFARRAFRLLLPFARIQPLAWRFCHLLAFFFLLPRRPTWRFPMLPSKILHLWLALLFFGRFYLLPSGSVSAVIQADAFFGNCVGMCRHIEPTFSCPLLAKWAYCVRGHERPSLCAKLCFLAQTLPYARAALGLPRGSFRLRSMWRREVLPECGDS